MQTKQSRKIMNDAFGSAFQMNQDIDVEKAVVAAEKLPNHAKDRRYLLTHEESVELVAKLGIFLNGDTEQVKELLARA